MVMGGKILCRLHFFSSQVEEKPSGTIYEVLSKNPRFSRLTRALNFVDDIASLLNDSSAHLTFFAPPDKVLRGPEHHHRPPSAPSPEWSSFDKMVTQSSLDEAAYITEFRDLTTALDLLDQLELASSENADDDKWKKILKIILRAILNYHIIPTAGYDISGLSHNLTYPTNLAIPGVFDGKPLRLRVTQTYIPPVTSINFFTKIRHPNVKSTNGIIHVVDRPLLPPPSVFQELYMFPRYFSILTSALQRSWLTHDLDLRWVRDKGLTGASLVTIFAPTNRAFEALPKKLQYYLFSPFGERVLKKLLQYHVVPNTVVHSNYVHHAHGQKSLEVALATPCECVIIGEGLDQDIQIQEPKTLEVMPWFMRFLPVILRRDLGEHKPPVVEPITTIDLTLETLFVNHTVHAHIAQNRINFPFPGKKPYIIDTKVFVNRELVIVPDIIGLNGAIHVINRLLDPRKPHHGHHHHGGKGEEDEEVDDAWVDWESWLIQWGEEQD
jgi:uncharacterized surface protein with fasciclin (FAS1) repeats